MWNALADDDQINTAPGGQGPRMGKLVSMICACTPSSAEPGIDWGEGASHRRLFPLTQPLFYFPSGGEG